jgi:alpha-D-ribose 1-methylphosphonate 5-triphosphate synthase subunit PhnH
MEGPGINGVRSLAAEPLPDDFADRLRANRELFPRGIDLVLVADDHVAALPRSIRIARGA